MTDNFVRQSKINLRQIVPLILIGVGLIIVGLAVLNLLVRSDAGGEYTVIPSKVNFLAPDITLNDLDGQMVSLSDYRQDVVLLNNWATWCPPCKYEMPTLLNYYHEHANQGFMLIGIEAGDPAEEVSQYVQEYKLNFPILLDPNNKSLVAFNNDSLPSSYVIDRSGYVVLAWTGPISHSMLEKFVTPLLEQ